MRFVKTVVPATVLAALIYVACGTLTAFAQEAEGPTASDNVSIDEPKTIAPEDIDSLINNLAGDREKIFQVRVFSFGQILNNYPESAITLERGGGEYNARAQSLIVTGTMNGTPIIEDLRFLELEDSFYIFRDIYLNGSRDDVSLGRAMPGLLIGNTRSVGEQESQLARTAHSLAVIKAAAAAPTPTIGAIHGYNDVKNVGINDGAVAMGTCGGTFDGGRVVNDQATIFYWEVIGSNFGSSKGTIQLAGITVPASAITQWTTTSIRFLPTVPYTWGPMTTTLSITTSSGLNVKNYVGIVPSVRTRIFGQCTYYVAYTRLNIGKQPSPSAYPTGSEPNAAPAPGKAPQGWTYITGDYVPQTGDQLEWNGHHTAIISKVDPFTKNGNITSWHVTIQEMNADCKNTLQLKASDFQIQNVNGKNQIKQAIQSNASKLGPPRSFYR